MFIVFVLKNKFIVLLNQSVPLKPVQFSKIVVLPITFDHSLIRFYEKALNKEKMNEKFANKGAFNLKVSFICG